MFRGKNLSVKLMGNVPKGLRHRSLANWDLNGSQPKRVAQTAGLVSGLQAALILAADCGRMTLVLYRCDLKVAEMIVCRKDQFIRRAVPSALAYEAWREGNDSSWNPPRTCPAIERSASEPRGDAASIKVAGARVDSMASICKFP